MLKFKIQSRYGSEEWIDYETGLTRMQAVELCPIFALCYVLAQFRIVWYR